jgi:hypothetical protein
MPMSLENKLFMPSNIVCVLQLGDDRDVIGGWSRVGY